MLDGGQLKISSQNISPNKADIKFCNRLLYIVLESLSNKTIKNFVAILNFFKIDLHLRPPALITELYYWRTCSYLRSVKQVKPRKWRILVLADAISMTTGPLFSCELPLSSRDPNDFTDAFPSRKQV